MCVKQLHIPGTNLQLFIRDIFPQFSGDTFEVLEGDFASFIIIKEFESFENFLSGIFFSLEEVSTSLRKKSSGYVVGNTQSYKQQALYILRNYIKNKFPEAQPAGRIRTKAEGTQRHSDAAQTSGLHGIVSFIAS